jgi:hypothetical protein
MPAHQSDKNPRAFVLLQPASHINQSGESLIYRQSLSIEWYWPGIHGTQPFSRQPFRWPVKALHKMLRRNND